MKKIQLGYDVMNINTSALFPHFGAEEILDYALSILEIFWQINIVQQRRYS